MRELMRRVWHAVGRRRFEADLAEEMEFHREMRQREIEAGGVPPAEAAAAARRALGSTPLAADHARDVWIAPWLRDIAQDLRFAARLLLKDRRFTLAAVLALGLGIAANNTVFTLVNALLIRDLPFDRADQLVALRTANAQGRTAGLTYADLRDWQASAAAFSDIGASTHGGAMTISGEARAPERLRGQYVSVNLFRLLRREPLLGRDFLPEDERPGAPAVVILGHAMWQSRYGGDPTIIGRTVRVNDLPSTIIGVMPPGFAYSFTAELWQPLSLWPERPASGRGGPGLDAIARLADGVDEARARAAAETIAARLAQAYPATNKDLTARVTHLNQGAMRGALPVLMTLMGAVGFVLLIACANVANLLLARAVQRGREIAIRASLGATRWRIVRQLLIECLLLATLAGAAGLVFSIYGVRFLGVAFDAREVAAPANTATPYWVDLSMNGPVLLFLTGVILATSLLFGLAPAWHVSKTNANALLKEDGRGSAGSARARRLTGAFLIAEIALTLVLLTGAGLLARSFLTLYYADYDIPNPSRLVIMRLALPEQKYRTPDQRARFFAALEARVAARPATASTVIASDVPVESMGGAMRALTIEGRAVADGTAPPRVAYVYASDRYFSTLGLRVTRGRAIEARDGAPGHEGAVVNERFAAMFFPGENPIGRRIRLAAAPANPGAAARADGGRNAPDAGATAAAGATGTAGAAQAAAQAEAPWLTIVGVAPNLPRLGPTRAPEPAVHAALRAEPAPGAAMSLIARGDGGIGPLTAALREDVRALDPDLPVYSIETLEAMLARNRGAQVLLGGFLGAIALIALVLAAVGLYALTAHGIAQRTQEIGIRMALGARAPQVVWLFMRRTLLQLAIGLALGLGGALAVGRLLQSVLVQTAPRDPLTLAIVSALLVIVSLAAAGLPARRAARLDPIAALRDD